jgi:HD superfamily phosphodiesterase
MDTTDIAGMRLPDSRIARDITQFVRDTAGDMLFHHSARVYWWGALAGRKLGLAFDPELLYAAAMFHDARHSGAHASEIRLVQAGAGIPATTPAAPAGLACATSMR